MICFEARTNQEVKEKGTCGSHLKKKNKTKQKEIDRDETVKESRERVFDLLFLFFLLSLLSSIYGNRIVGIRRGKIENALLDEGYAWEQKTRDFVEFSIKNSENPMFWFFSDLRLSDGQNWSEQEANLIHASRGTCGYQNLGVLSNSTRYGFHLNTYMNSK